jgi:DNA gyrase subunit A
VLTLTTLEPDSPGLALGTKRGVVKRVTPDHLANKDSWEVIRLDEGDELAGAVELHSGREQLVFVSSDAQLLHFEASGVRPQGRGGGGIAGIRLSPGATVVFFGALRAGVDGSVVTVAGSGDALPGTEAGSLKVSRFAEYPGKGRGTGGVRCHRFLKGEETLLLAWAGATAIGAPAIAAAASGAPVDLPEPTGRRDGSGAPAPQPIVAVAGPAALLTPSVT